MVTAVPINFKLMKSRLMLFLLMLLPFNSLGQPVVNFDKSGKAELYNKAFVYRDAGGQLTFKDVLIKSFTPAVTTMFGVTADAVWLRFSIYNASADTSLYFDSGMAALRSVDVYQLNRGKVKHLHTGLDTSFSSRDIPISNMVVPVVLPAAKITTLYVRYRSDNAVAPYPRLVSAKQLLLITHQINIVTMLYFGLIAALVMYNMFIFILIKEKVYLYYVLYCICWAINLAFVYGYTAELLFNEPSVFNNTIIFCSPTLLFYTLFTVNFFDMDKKLPGKRFRILISILIFIDLLPLVFYAAGQTNSGFILVKAISFVSFALFISYSIYRYIKGFKPAVFYGIGFTAFNAGIVVYVLKDAGMLPVNFFTYYVMLFSSAAEALTWAFAMSDKLNFFKKETERVRALSEKQSQKNKKSLLVFQEDERKRLAHELHDSVTQNLIVEKNRVLLQLNKMPEFKPTLEKIRDGLANTIDEVRAIAYGLRPALLDHLGLTTAIKTMVSELRNANNLIITTAIENIDNLLVQENHIHVYRIIQESFNNILKHANATKASLVISANEKNILIVISDNGRGLQHPDAVFVGLGMAGINERVKALNATVDFAGNKGTVLTIKIPL